MSTQSKKRDRQKRKRGYISVNNQCNACLTAQLTLSLSSKAMRIRPVTCNSRPSSVSPPQSTRVNAPLVDNSQLNISLLPTTSSPDCATIRFNTQVTNGDKIQRVVTQTSSVYAAIGFHELRNRCQPPFSASKAVEFSMKNFSQQKDRI